MFIENYSLFFLRKIAVQNVLKIGMLFISSFLPNWCADALVRAYSVGFVTTKRYFHFVSSPQKDTPSGYVVFVH